MVDGNLTGFWLVITPDGRAQPMQRPRGAREQLALEEPAGSEAKEGEVPVGMYVASRASLAKAPGCYAGEF